MYWIVQQTLGKEEAIEHLEQELSTRGIQHSFVKVIPFSPADSALEPEPNATGSIFAVGTTTLLRIAQHRGWSPGAFYDPTLDFREWKKHWGKLLLNYDATITTFGALNITEQKFIRPLADLKIFTGSVVAPYHFDNWRESCLRYQTDLTAEVEILVAAPRQILEEYRLLVVGGKVVTGSRYGVDKHYSPSPIVPIEVLTFGQYVVDKWNPLPAYALDIAITPRDLAIIETNCINASGWYMSDVGALVDAIEILSP